MQRRLGALALVLAGALGLSGCIVVEDNDHDRHHHDNGGGGGGGGGDRGGYDHDRDRDRDSRPTSPPPQEPASPPPQNEGDFGGLPYMGDIESQLPAGRGGEVWLKRGWYKVKHGPYKIEANDLVIHGNGIDNTVIKGDVEVHGMNNILSNLNIHGDLEIHGDGNQFQNVMVRGKYRDKGHGNKHF